MPPPHPPRRRRVARHGGRRGAPGPLGGPAPELYTWIVDGSPPPEGLSLWVARDDPRGGEAEGRYEPLPDGAFCAQRGWSFLAMGHLNFTLIHHPGAEVEHPFEARGLAVRLWPPADAVDIGALPYSLRDDVLWLDARSSGDVIQMWQEMRDQRGTSERG